MSNTTPTFGASAAGAAVVSAPVVSAGAVVASGAVSRRAAVPLRLQVPRSRSMTSLSLPHAAAVRPSKAMAASDVNRLVLRIDSPPWS